MACVGVLREGQVKHLPLKCEDPNSNPQNPYTVAYICNPSDPVAKQRQKIPEAVGQLAWRTQLQNNRDPVTSEDLNLRLSSGLH